MFKSIITRLKRQDLLPLCKRLDDMKMNDDQILSCLLVLTIHYDIDYMTLQERKEHIASEVNEIIKKDMGVNKIGLKKGDRKTTAVATLFEEPEKKKHDDRVRHDEFIRRVERRGAKILNKQDLLDYMLRNACNPFSKAVVRFSLSNIDFALDAEANQVAGYWLGDIKFNSLKLEYVNCMKEYDSYSEMQLEQNISFLIDDKNDEH